jgi:hypothetical protein
VGDFEGVCGSEYFYALVEMLSVEVHEVGGLVFAEAACEEGLVVSFGLCGFG